MSGTFGEVLREFKESESPEYIVPLVEDETLRKAVVAWKSVPIIFKAQEECQLKDEGDRWRWLWTRIEYDVNTFGIVAGVKAQEAGTLLMRLIGLRLIYPDGSINDLAKRYLQTIIIAKLPKQKRTDPAKG